MYAGFVWKTLKHGNRFYSQMKCPVLYYNDISPPSRFILMTIKELDLNIDQKVVDLFTQQHLTEDFLKMNPLHTVPTLVDDDVTITDSHAIASYLVKKFSPNSNLYPNDIKKQARIDRIMYFNNGILFPKESKLMQNPFNPNHRDVPFSKIMDDYLKALSYLEAFCKQNKWLAGETMTLADLCCIATYSSAELLAYKKDGHFPNVERWVEQCKMEECYKSSEQGVMNLKEILDKFGEFGHIDEKYKEHVNNLISKS